MAEAKNPARLPGLIGGLAFFAAAILIAPPAGLPLAGWQVAGVALMMATWWMTVAAPIPVTALLPLVLFPLLGVANSREAAAPYADPIIFLFLGGFILGIAMQRVQLHVRIGLTVLSLVGSSPKRLLGGMLIATALVSMWVSNSATAIMMLPVAMSILALVDERAEMDARSRENMGIVLVLAVAYGATIGGFGTLIGSPTNAYVASYMEREHGVEIGFAQWMALGVPIVVVMTAGAWLVLARLYPVVARGDTGATAAIAAELRKLGPMRPAEMRVALIFTLTALAWITRPLYGDLVPGIDDTLIAMIAALAMFFVPAGGGDSEPILDWETAARLPWGVLLLFGGGLSLAAAISDSGLAVWVGTLMEGLRGWPVFAIVAVAALGMVFLTELTSNTASAAALLPLGSTVAVGIGFDPILIAIPLTLAASCGFMMPVGTPPNAIAYASGRVTVLQMVYAGLWLNILGVAIILAVSYAMVGWIFL
jgi:sodium-dependent dicarboxylate transporter 2/3/5